MLNLRNTHTPFIIFKYISKRYLKTIIFTSIVLTLIWLMADSIELARKLSTKDTPDFYMLRLELFNFIGIYLEILPFSVLIAAVLCFSNLARNNELISIRASGVSVWQFLTPAFVVAFLVGLFGVVVLNPLAAKSQTKYERLEAKVFPGKSHGLIVNGRQLWLRYSYGKETFIIHSQNVRKKGMELDNVSVYLYNGNKHFVERIESDLAKLISENGVNYWFISEGTKIAPQKRREIVQNVKIPTQLTSDDIQVSFSSYKTISVFQTPSFIESLESAGFSTLKYKVMFWSTLSLPLLCMVMLILAAPFAIHFSRRGGVGKLLFMGLVFGFVFYMFNNVILTLAQAGRLNLYIAIIIPILIAGLVGVYTLLHFREE